MVVAEPVESTFYNKVMDRTAIKQLISRLISHFGTTYTAHVLDQPKTLGFRQATPEAISLGIDDLLAAPSKGWLIRDAEQYANISDKHHNYGSLHAVEKLRQLIETWYATSEYSKQEMSPNFGITDPSNPVHVMSFSGARGSTSQVHQLVGMRGLMSDPQGQIIDLPIQSNFREGLSLTEYIIPCYGARKGVVDTAVRTSDAGYLTRRLVEVVQHIVVRKTDCGTIRGISVSNLEGKGINLYQQKLVGRVLSDDIYSNSRCLATRNQDIGTSLANRLLMHKAKAISIRSPLTCESIFWICQLCYGWSLTHGDLIDVGEAVGIIAGQSIGEPGTQLTLRTFHTGGVFAGDIAEHVRTPSNGVIQFDEDLVTPTRTRHGHPAWICRGELLLKVKSQDRIHNLTIPGKSLLLVQNNQCVESKHVIAEIRAENSPLKEKVEKYIYSDLEGEIHRSAEVRHASKYIRSDTHLVLGTSHVWILAGNIYGGGSTLPVFYRDRDEIDSKIPTARGNSLPPFTSRNRNHLNIHIFRFYLFGEEEPTESDVPIYRDGGGNNSIESAVVLSSHRVRRSSHSFSLVRRGFGKRSISPFILQLPEGGFLQHNEILAVPESSRYKSGSSGIIKYGDVGVESIGKRNDDSEYGEIGDFRPKYKVVGGGNFFLIPEDIYESSSPFLVDNESFVEAGTPLTHNTYSRVGGFVKTRERSGNNYELRLLPGHIHHPKENYRISKQASALLPPGEKLFDKFQSKNWTYIEWIARSDGRDPIVLVRPAIEYRIPNKFVESNPLNFRTDRNIFGIETMEYLLYGDGERIRVKNGRDIRLVRTRLVLRWEGTKFVERAHASFVRIGTRNRSRFFPQFSLVKYYRLNVLERYARSFGYTSHHSDPSHQPFPRLGDPPISKHQGLIRITPHKNRGMTSFIVVSPSDSIRTSDRTRSINCTGREKRTSSSPTGEFFDFEKRSMSLAPRDGEMDGMTHSVSSTTENPVRIDLFEKLGLLGHLYDPVKHSGWAIRGRSVSNQISVINHYQEAVELPEWFFIDEVMKIRRFLPGGDVSDSSMNRCSPTLFPPVGTELRVINVGQFIFENFDAPGYGSVYQSGQIVSICTNHLVIRLAKPYLATGGATVHNNYGESVREGDTLVTLIYERLKSGDIIQGLPKVEQLLEARPINSVSIDLGSGFGDWNKDLTKFIGNLWGFSFGGEISIEQARIHLVEQIQKVYESQAVHVSDKHVEIIVRQVTSKAVTLGDGTNSVFLPGELIEFSRAKRMNRALEEAIPYRPISLGVTKASSNTRSSISEASFQETTRILAEAALKGRTDWLKGLKENVILGAVIPAGTGSREVLWQITSEKHKEFHSRRRGNNSMYRGVGDTITYRTISHFFTAAGSIHMTLEESSSGSSIGINI